MIPISIFSGIPNPKAFHQVRFKRVFSILIPLEDHRNGPNIFTSKISCQLALPPILRGNATDEEA